MLKKMIAGIFVASTLVIALSTHPGTANAASRNDDADNKVEHLKLSEGDCFTTCYDCQKNCAKTKSAGSERTDCWRACTSVAAGCCAGNGKKSPTGLSCNCR